MFIALTAVDTTFDRAGGSTAPKRGTISPRILTETTLKSTMRLKKKEHCEGISPHLPVHSHTLSPDKLLLYLVKLLPCYPAGTHTNTHNSESCFQQNMRLLSQSKHYCRGWYWEKHREAAILELLLHRQWLIQCNVQLYSAFSELLGDFNSVKVCQRSK